MPVAARKGHAPSGRFRRRHAATIPRVSPEEKEAEPGASGVPAESAGPLLAPAAPGAPPATAAPAARTPGGPAGPGRRSTRVRLLGWLLGTGFIIGVAWLLTSLITGWT